MKPVMQSLLFYNIYANLLLNYSCRLIAYFENFNAYLLYIWILYADLLVTAFWRETSFGLIFNNFFNV